MAKKRLKNRTSDDKDNFDFTSNPECEIESMKEVIHEGLLVLGCIQEIDSHRLIMAIPGYLGTVDIFHISKAFNDEIKQLLDAKNDSILNLPSVSEMFQVGDVLCCKVLQKCSHNGKFPWILTIDPKAVNGNLVLSKLSNDLVLNCYVEAIGDDNVTINAGCDGTKKVLKLSDFDQFLEKRKNKKLYVGQVLPCVVTFLKDRYLHAIYEIMMTVNPTKVAAAQLEQNQHFSLIPPGCKFISEIKELLPMSITLLTYGNECKVVVPRLHLVKRWDKINECTYKPGTKVEARILLYHSESKTLFTTLQTRLVETYSKASILKHSKNPIVENAKVVAKSEKVVFWKCDKNLRGISKLPKQKIGIINVFEIGSQHKCKILYSNSMDDLLRLECVQDTVTFNGLKCGDLVVGTIVKLNTKMAFVEISKKVTGVIDSMQLINCPVVPELQQKITCRVLSVYPDTKGLFLACNPKLVESKLPIIDSYENVKRGQITHGTVIGFKNQQVAVMLYNNIRVEVDVSDIIDPPEKSVTCFFRIGDVVKCTVMKVDVWNEQLQLSIQKSSKFVDRVGNIYECKVIHVDEDGLQVNLVGFAAVQKHILPVMHLSDQSHLCEELRKTYKVGDTIREVVVISKGVVSRKMSFIQWYRMNSVQLTFDGFQVGKIYPAVCRGLYESVGIYVSLPGGYVGFNNKIKYTTGNESVCVENATIFARITAILPNSRHIAFDLATKFEPIQEDRMIYTKSIIQDLHQINSHVFGSIDIGDEVVFKAASMKIDLVSGKVDETRAILYKNQVDAGFQIHIGETYRAVVIYLDPVNRHIEVSLKSDVISALSSRSLTPMKKFSKQICTCILVKQEFNLAIVNGDFAPKFVYSPGVKYGNSTMADGLDSTVGSQMSLFITFMKKHYGIGINDGPADDIVQNDKVKVKRKISNGTSDQVDHGKKSKLQGYQRH